MQRVWLLPEVFSLFIIFSQDVAPNASMTIRTKIGIQKNQLLYELALFSSLGPGHLQLNSKSLKSQGLSQISKRLGPGACSNNCNVSTHHPGNFSVQNNFEISSCMNWIVILWKILGNFRWLNFLDARFLLGLHCASTFSYILWNFHPSFNHEASWALGWE